MEKCESKMDFGERWALTNHLVATANDEAVKNDKLHISCFNCTGGLMNWTKSEAGKLTKPQGVTSHDTMPETRAQVSPVDHGSINVSLLTGHAGILLPENDTGNSGIC